MSTDYHSYAPIGAPHPLSSSSTSSFGTSTHEEQAKQVSNAAMSAGIIPSNSFIPSIQRTNRPQGPIVNFLSNQRLQTRSLDVSQSTHLTHQAPIAWTQARPSNPSTRTFYQPRIVTYQKHELIELNKELKLNLTESHIEEVSSILQKARTNMEQANPDGVSINLPSQSSHTITLNIRQEGIHLNLGQIGQGGYKVVNSSVKIAKLVHPRQSSKSMKPPPFAKIKVEGTLIQQPKTADEAEELRNEKRINQTLRRTAKENPETCSHIATSKWFTYEFTGEMGFRSEKINGDVEKGNRNFTQRQRLQAAIGCCKGVAQLHQAGVIHRDIKLDNFLYTTDAEGNITAKVADMGKSVNTRDPESTKWHPNTWALKYIPLLLQS